MSSVTIQSRVSPELKEQAVGSLRGSGLSTADAIRVSTTDGEHGRSAFPTLHQAAQLSDP